MRALFLLLPLAACHGPVAQPANTTAPAESGYIAKVKALPPAQRDGVLLRAIAKGGGAACQGVSKTQALPSLKTGQPEWLVTCAEGSQWQVSLADDGTALVTGARDPNG